MKLSKKLDSTTFSKRVNTRLNQEPVDLFIDDESSKASQFQFAKFIKSTKFPQVEIDSDGASISSSANGSSSSCEERERLKNPKSNPNYLKATTSSEKKKMNLLVSDLTDSESSCVSFDEKKKVLRNTISKSTPNFKRNTSMRTLRILMSKPKMGTCSQLPEGASVIKPTCSSALKDSKLPHIEVEPEERESDKLSVLRVCNYTYCSLHGQHNHSSTPTLKRMLSKRRRFSKTQKIIKRSTSDSGKGTKTKKLVVDEDSKGRKRGKSSKVVSSKSKVKVAKGDEKRNLAEIYSKNSESTSEPIGYDEVPKKIESGDGKKKRMSMWYLIHQQMVSGLAEGIENQEIEIQKPGSEKREMENQDTCVEYKEAGNQEMEIQKIYATKMVREAIEKILLPEVPDQSPEDMSICSDAPSASEQEIFEKRDPSEDPQQGESTKKKAPKSWSNLKKLILLKSFVKELEKVRKINPHKPRFVGSDQEGEKVNLKRKGLEKKKSGEEWMLDYALQQAVSELAPTQKRKVELLIKAFENVVPSLDGEQSPLPFPKFKSIKNERDRDDESNVIVERKFNQGGMKDESNLSEHSQEIDDVINDQNEDDDEESLDANKNDSSCFDSGMIEQFTEEEEIEHIDSLKTMVSVNDQKFSLTESMSEKLKIDEVPLTSNLKHGPTVDSKTENCPLRTFKAKFTKPKNMSMWHMIHQQMVAGLDDENKNGNENKIENEKGSGDANTVSECDDIETQEVELRKVFAIKMVREAIEKILLPEVEDDQSTTSETVSEQDLIEKKQEEDWGSQIFNSFGSTKEDVTHYSTNKIIYDMSLTQETNLEVEKDEPKIEKRAKKQAPKRWSNLKKWILLQKFVKALEKVKDFTPKKRQLLPLKIDPEGEVVRLRNQMTGEKRNAEEWMLDYALRKVVSELAPKQKKKVELLVKAFETVAPPTEEIKSPVTIPKLKGTEGVQKLKNIFATKNDDGSNDSANTVENSDVVSRLPFKDMKLDGLGSDTSGESIASKGNENKILGLKSFGNLTSNTQSEKHKHMKMWHLLCQHVVSEIAVKVDDSSEIASPHENPTFDQNKYNEDRSLHFSKSDAVKLVKEAINEILVPDIQDDSSDTLSIASDLSLDQDLLEEKKPRNWDKLKKMILLKRSIKALEKVRRSNSRAPRHLPLESGREEEKVDLKRQMSDERKKAEEWMLDYAVQHIVTKLTPDRKRRVSMLVEAFEAVVPLPQI